VPLAIEGMMILMVYLYPWVGNAKYFTSKPDRMLFPIFVFGTTVSGIEISGPTVTKSMPLEIPEARKVFVIDQSDLTPSQRDGLQVLPPLAGFGDEQAGRTERREAAAAARAVRREFSLVGLELFFLARGRAFRAASGRIIFCGGGGSCGRVGHGDKITCLRGLVKIFSDAAMTLVILN
jgi:hypothetical protein